jgi:hypothetical protein
MYQTWLKGIRGKRQQRWEGRIRNNRRGNTSSVSSPIKNKIKKKTFLGPLVPISCFAVLVLVCKCLTFTTIFAKPTS